MLSIIVAVYNEQLYIRRCIESVLTSSMKELEVVLVDDGSNDNSPQICEEYAKIDNRVKVVHKGNGGLISARMCGIKEARFDYLSFLDADDWVDEDLYENLFLPILNDNKVDVVVSPYVINSKGGECRHKFKKRETVIFNQIDALTEMFKSELFDWSGCGKIYKKADVMQFADTWWYQSPIGEDVEWNWKVFNTSQKVCYVPIEGYHYFENVNSMSHKEIDMNNLVLIDRIERMILEEPGNYKVKQALWMLLMRKCTEKIFFMICFEDNKDCEIEKCMMALLNIPEDIRNNMTGKIRRQVELCLRGTSELYIRKKKNEDELFDYCRNITTTVTNEIYIYGAGTIGEYIADCLDKERIEYEGFVISKPVKQGQLFHNKEMICIDEFFMAENFNSKWILLALNLENKKEVEQILIEKGFSNFIDVGKYSFYY